ncbi:MAG: hypothetical protein E6K18_08080 [Methanobacteriota archaeon]|nr:MAG: hypothetical protein E6K18_08080 [Euryarchaeota archaeon]
MKLLTGAARKKVIDAAIQELKEAASYLEHFNGSSFESAGEFRLRRALRHIRMVYPDRREEHAVRRITMNARTGDVEVDHHAADDAIIELLKSLEYEDALRAYQMTKRWFA